MYNAPVNVNRKLHNNQQSIYYKKIDFILYSIFFYKGKGQGGEVQRY